MVEATEATGTLLVLLSGGASALTEVPVDGLTLGDLVKTYRQLLRAGLPIDKINTVRRHLSALKNGGLLATTRAATVTLLLSDVVGADASAIGSGPTLADSSTPAEALAIADEAGIAAMLPEAVIDALRNSNRPNGASPPHRWTIVADGSTAASAAVDYIRKCGFLAQLDPDPIAGDAAEQGREMASSARASTVIVRHGESVVKVQGDSPGGRNQHAALSGAIAFQGKVAVFAALATDGRDGLTESAGAIVDGETCDRIQRSGIDPGEMLAGCRSHEALAASGDLVITGPTGTNVADLWMVWRRAD
jgi:hydroxypyruvate reductase